MRETQRARRKEQEIHNEAHNCKAVLENSSYRPLGDTEPQPTFAKTSVANGPKVDSR